jgi:hypothetical protein
MMEYNPHNPFLIEIKNAGISTGYVSIPPRRAHLPELQLAGGKG